MTDHTYEDCKLMKDAEEKGLPNEVGLVEFQKLLNKLGYVEYRTSFLSVGTEKIKISESLW